MNPLIICKELINGALEVQLNQQCNCFIGLVSITLPVIQFKGNSLTEIYVSCDQIDATITNRKRIISIFGYKNQPKKWSTYNFENILYFKVDSAEKKLVFRLFNSDVPLTPKNDSQNSSKVIMSLNMIPITNQKL